MGHVFVSYSHRDKAYVHKLADGIRARGFDIWIDDRIDYGSRWPKVIQENLDTCDAFIVVISENSYESEWVQSEVARAKRKGKPFFPLLLSGDPWLSIEVTQYVDVRNQSLPPEKFYERLELAATRSKQLSALPPKLKVTQVTPISIKEKLKTGNRAKYIVGSIVFSSILCICGIYAFGSTMNYFLDPRTMAKGWPNVIYDKFDSTSNNWLIGDTQTDLYWSHIDTTSGFFFWIVNGEESYTELNSPFSGPAVSDFLLAVDGENFKGSLENEYGLTFRKSDDGSDYYTFIISNNTFAFLLRKNDAWRKLIDWSISPAIKPNEPNRITVLAIGSHFTFYINDEYVDEFDDNQLPTGTVALYIASSAPDNFAWFRFDNFELRWP
jgi:hypothetical protein